MSWQKQLKNQYLKREKSVFLLTGNTRDIFPLEKEEVGLADYLAQKIFGPRKIVMQFTIGEGLRFRDMETKNLFHAFLSVHGLDKNDLSSSSDMGLQFELLNRFIKTHLEENSMALIIDEAALLLPNEDLNNLDFEDKKVIVTLLDWARDKRILSHDVTIVLLTENREQIQPYFVRNTDIASIEVEMPSETERKKAIRAYGKQYNVETELSQKAISKIINGLNIKQIKELFLQFQEQKISYDHLINLKKEIIEKENFGFIEFVETERTLDDVAGHDKAKTRLREDAKLLQEGKSDILPMGYLICGPVGTGKSYLAECFAGEAGIPVVKVKNFRERWVGATEANFEKILKTLENLSPVVVLIDEADAALGTREQGGDSGTSKRIFSSLAQVMGNTKNRGKLLWMLLTARPELVPIDLKRQGRAEIHIPLFYPKTLEEKKAFFHILAKKIGFPSVKHYTEMLTEERLKEIRSGADIESVLIKIKRTEALAKLPLPKEKFLEIVQAFRSSLSQIEVEKQIKAALAETTDMDLLSNKI